MSILIIVMITFMIKWKIFPFVNRALQYNAYHKILCYIYYPLMIAGLVPAYIGRREHKRLSTLYAVVVLIQLIPGFNIVVRMLIYLFMTGDA